MTNHIFWRNAGGVSILTIALLTVCALISACSEDFHLWTEEASGNKISIGGIDTDAMMVSGISSRATGATRATGVAAESMDWLLKPLKDGIDITYGWSDPTSPNNHQDVAILKLKDGTDGKPYATENGLAVYDFNYRQNSTTHTTNNAPAIWYDNGPHYFQGVHVPERIRYTSDATEVYSETTGKAKNLTLDQHDGTTNGTDDKLGNYTLLSHYLGMPANFKLTATIERIKLPFRHRLARVIAFVLIDPELNTTLKGYNLKRDKDGEITEDEDPTTTSFRFCNVKVLQGVKDEVGADGHHTLTPTWYEARKVIPHFEGEKGSYSYKTNQELDGANNFKYYYKYDDNGRLQQLFPTSKGWEDAHNASNHNGYTEVDYGKVPVYDIIVRPTYTRADSVMYDEEGLDPKASDYKTKLATYAAVKNKIDFEIELENGLRYEKRFEFDLNANYQTVVYLRVAREHVDYNDAGSELWIEEKNDDAWYGVDNENGNTLSLAGSSWQRAYTYGAVVTGGVENTNPHSTEGVTDGHFYNASSTVAERENAQYFTSEYQSIWVRKFLQACQGGAHHGDYFVLQQDITIDARLIPDNFVFTGHLDGQDHIIKLTNVGETVTDKEAWDEDRYEVATEADYSSPLFVKSGDAYVAYTMPTLYSKVHHDAVLYTEGDDIPAGKNVGDVKENAYDEYVEAHPTVAEMMAGTYYVKTAESTYEVYPKPTLTLYANHPIHHDAITHQSPAFLFAGLDGEYTTAQESNPSLEKWEANVHRETNDFGSGTHWVPTLGYRAEVINVRVASPATVFEDDATITGNVQNCWNKWNTDKSHSEKVSDHTPAIPHYK